MLVTSIVIVLVLALALVVAFAVATKLVHICQPNEALIFSGVRRRDGDLELGYRVVQGGRGMRIPLFETVDRLDLTNMVIDVRVEGAYSKGGIPLNVNAVANVKIASSEPVLANAIERFLGKPRKLVETVAKETLEGNLRGVLATLTPEEVNHDRVKFAQSLLHEADTDLRRLGLVLDTLKIQNVSDDKGYLDSLGRKQSAELQMRSRVAEADNRALAAERDAENFESRAMARIEAEVETLAADTSRRIVDAQTKRSALAAEQQSEVTALVARARAEMAVQAARVEQMRLKLEADEIAGAIAERDRRTLAARGSFAGLVEDGKAQAHALREMGRAWKRCGADGRRIFVSQRVGTLAARLIGTTPEAPIETFNVVDARLAGDGSSLAARSRIAATELRQGLGVDVARLVDSVAGALDR